MNLLVVYVKQLPTLDDVEGNEQVFAYSPTLGRNVRISVDTLRRGEGTPIWSQNDANDGVYDIDFIVEWQLKFWKSLVNNNATIPTEGASWTEVSSSGNAGINNSFRGAYDASTDLYPATGGSGLDGLIRGGDEWHLSVAGTLNGEEQGVGTIVKALVNNPGQVNANWRLI
jgi:hypothetical protein